jgi:class 3 adenylate cyclase
MSAHGGRIVKRTGDGHLIAFSSPLNAVLSGIRAQKAVKRLNVYRGEHRRVSLGIGIDRGEVISADGDAT